jgi:hypothetical protein
VKAVPLKMNEARYDPCPVAEATHVLLNMPGRTFSKTRILPLKRPLPEGGFSSGWEWNGDTEAPTITPSINTTNAHGVCHSLITNGNCAYLSDCTHADVGQTLTLLDDV